MAVLVRSPWVVKYLDGHVFAGEIRGRDLFRRQAAIGACVKKKRPAWLAAAVSRVHASHDDPMVAAFKLIIHRAGQRSHATLKPRRTFPLLKIKCRRVGRRPAASEII